MRSYATPQAGSGKSKDSRDQDCISWYHLELIFGALAFLTVLKGLVHSGHFLGLSTPLTCVVLLLALALFGHGLRCWRRSLKRLHTQY